MISFHSHPLTKYFCRPIILFLLSDSLPKKHRGLAAGDGDSVQQALPLAQKGKKIILAELRDCRGNHQAAVVTEGAAEVAAHGEDRAGHPPGEVQQGHQRSGMI